MLNIAINTLFDQRYMIMNQLGEGGMGLVFAAQDTQRDHLPCAIKVLRNQHQEKQHSIKRLVQERLVMSKLKHQHIVEVFDVVASSKSEEHYIVMPLLQGKTFKQWFYDKQQLEDQLDVQSFLRLMCQVLDALHYAHAMGVVHRDLKPDNLFVCEEDGRPSVKILDFGIAKDLDSLEHLTAEVQNSMVGTPRYMSPEQIHNQTITPQTDLYAVAIMIYEYITGVHPFELDELKDTNPMKGLPTALQMSWHHINSTPIPLKHLGKLGHLLANALEKDPTKRPKSAHFMKKKIKTWLTSNQEIISQSIPLGIPKTITPNSTPAPESASFNEKNLFDMPELYDDVKQTRATNQVSQEVTPLELHPSLNRKSIADSKISYSSFYYAKNRILLICRYLLWLSVLMLILSWSWYLTGRPHLSYIHDYVAPILTLICDSGLTLNLFFEILFRR